MKASLPPNVRSRDRADGTRRLWWEPPAAARAMGFDAVDLDPERLTWSRREAERLNREVEAARKRGVRDRASASGGRTVEALIEDYRRSARWRSRAERTRQDYAEKFAVIVAKWGPQKVADFTKPAMWTWYQASATARGPYMALALIRIMSLLFAHAERIGWRPAGSNPCARIGAEVPKGRERTASWDEIDALTEAADAAGLPSVALAVALSALSGGQRQTDILGARVGHFHRFEIEGSGEVWLWQLTRSKRGNAGVVPIQAEVAPRLAAAVAGRQPAEPLLRDDLTGQAFTPDSFDKRWRQARTAAAVGLPGLATLQFRDLRRTFGNLSRAGGASVDDVADLLGNTAARNAQLRAIYMAPQLATTNRAIAAIQRPKKERKA